MTPRQTRRASSDPPPSAASRARTAPSAKVSGHDGPLVEYDVSGLDVMGTGRPAAAGTVLRLRRPDAVRLGLVDDPSPKSTKADEAHPDPTAERVLYPDEVGGFRSPAPETAPRLAAGAGASQVVADDLEAAHHWDNRLWKR